MKPKKQERSRSDDLFRMRLEQMLDQRHALYRLAGKIDWTAVEERFGGLYAEEGRPGIPIRLMVGLHYLKHAFNESDETVVERWVENPYWQYFCGEEYFRHEMPIDPSQMTRFRDRIGETGCEFMLGLTVLAGIAEAVSKPPGGGECGHHSTGQGDRSRPMPGCIHKARVPWYGWRRRWALICARVTSGYRSVRS